VVYLSRQIMTQKPVSRKTPLAKAQSRKNVPRPNKIRDPVVKKLAQKQAGTLIKKIENTVAARSDGNGAGLSVVKVDKNFMGQLKQLKKMKNPKKTNKKSG
jgi:hypothetical protein